MEKSTHPDSHLDPNEKPDFDQHWEKLQQLTGSPNPCADQDLIERIDQIVAGED